MTTVTPAERSAPMAVPPPLEMARMLPLLLRDRLGLMSGAARYGDAVRLGMGPMKLYFLNQPAHAKHVLADNAANYRKGFGLAQARRALGDGLLTSEGGLWREQRKVIGPAFQQRRIAAQDTAIAEEAAALVDRLRRRAGGAPIDVVPELTELTLGVLGRTLLDADLRPYGSLPDAFETVQDQAMFEAVTLSKVPPRLPIPRQLRFRRARRELQRVVDVLVAQRRRAGLGDDVLSRLIASAGEEPDRRVGRRRMRDELVTLLLAGHETTASTLSWSLHLLDRHPEVAERLHDEAAGVLGDRLPRADDLRSLTYTGQVLHEVMRLYPPVWMLSRIALSEDEIDGHRMSQGADVLICPYTLHRHPDYWNEPLRFDPERFAPGRSADRPRYAYIPFGAGPRVCVGSHLGLMEATFTLALIARELRLTGVPGRPVVPEGMLSLRVRGGLPMRVTTR